MSLERRQESTNKIFGDRSRSASLSSEASAGDGPAIEMKEIVDRKHEGKPINVTASIPSGITIKPLGVDSAGIIKNISAETIKWNINSSVFIEEQISAEAGDKEFKTLQFALGPEINFLNRQYKEAGVELEWKQRPINIKWQLCEKINQIANVFNMFVKYEWALSRREEEIKENKETDEVVIQFKIIKDEHDKIKKQMDEHNLEEYFDWLEKKRSLIDLIMKGTFLGKSILVLDDKQISLTEEHKKILRKLIDAKFNAWYNEKFYEIDIQRERRAQYIMQARELKNELVGELLKGTTVYDFKQALLHNSQHLKNEMVAIEAEINKQKINQNEELKSKAEIIVKKYRDAASEKLKDPKIVLRLKTMLFPEDKTGYEGITDEELVELIIQRNEQVNPHNLNDKQVNQLFDAVPHIKNELVRKQFQIELEKHFLSERFHQGLKSAQCLNELKTWHSQTLSQLREENEAAVAGCLRLSKNPIALLSASIEIPLQWYQLKMALSVIDCHSEAQIIFKRLLLDYIQKRDTDEWSPWFNAKIWRFDVNELMVRRRQVEYLIGCLHWASLRQIDEGVLFNVIAEKSDEESKVSPQEMLQQDEQDYVGIDFILKHYEASHTSSSVLKDRISDFIKMIKEGSIFYLCDLTKIAKEVAIVIEKTHQELAPVIRTCAVGNSALTTSNGTFTSTYSPLVTVSLSRPAIKKEHRNIGDDKALRCLL